MKIGAISLGCDKNRVDTENLLGFALQAGHQIVNDVQSADAVIINTCAFLQSAVKESIETLMSVRSCKNVKYVLLCGCLPQRYFDEILAEDGLPEADAMIANTEYHRIGEVLDALQKGERVILRGDESMTRQCEKRVITTPYHYAYLKIAEGCNNKCTYCAIPNIRGKYRSERQDNLVAEAERLVNNGCKELILVAQDVTRFGSDGDGSENLLTLLKKLCALPLERVRLLYCYPDMLSDEIIDFVDSEPKMAKYIDMPLQHASDTVLRRMNRRDTVCSIKRKLDYIRSKASGISVRSTFMVGFPGETDDEFAELCCFIKQQRLDHVGFFAYSREQGTPACKMKEQVSAKVKKQRLDTVVALQSEIAVAKQNGKVGSVQDVIYDGIDYDKNMFFGHTDKTMPDVDEKVYFKSAYPVNIGCTYPVKIQKVKKLDLYGITVEEQ